MIRSSFFLFLMTINFINAQEIDFKSPLWDISAESHEVFVKEEKSNLKLVDGRATLKSAKFKNGVIEFKMLFDNEVSFPGILFRGQNEKNYEEFYIRPWLSGNIDATQYSPVYEGLSGWQIYHGEQYSCKTNFRFNTWLTFKLVVKDKLMDIFIDNMNTPLYTVELKRRIKEGYIALKNSFGPVFFSDFKVKHTDNVNIKGKPVPELERKKGTVTRWQISQPFKESLIKDEKALPNGISTNTFKTVFAEKTGILNIPQYIKRKSGQNTVLLKVGVLSQEDQIIPFQLGFSDRVRVYINEVLIFYANDGWRTRDYKFLGTVGLHDELYLPLKKGNNEVVLAVSESFGGWGVIARFPEVSNIKN